MEKLTAKDVVAIIKAGHESQVAKIAMNGLLIEYQSEKQTPILTSDLVESLTETQNTTESAAKVEDIPLDELMYIDAVAFESKLAMEG